tara:strand:- start:150 stop:1481 length:1332 start_codon:yes stop_codon:yes gene_type:complete
MQSSPHTARWINCVRYLGVRIVVFPSVLVDPCPDLEPFVGVRCREDVEQLAPGVIGVVSRENVACAGASRDGEERVRDTFPSWIESRNLPDALALQDWIAEIRPDLLHSMEFLCGAYLVLEVRRTWPEGRPFPPWLASSWGGDVFFARQFERHVPILREILCSVDAFQADCNRDVEWALTQGFDGYRFPPMPASGGADFSEFPALEDLTPPSRRKLIVVKGYHGWAGRGVHALLAIHRVASRLRGFKIVVTNAGPPVVDMVERLRADDGLDIEIASYLPSNKDAILRLASARFAVGYGVADGIATTLLEAMAVGTFMVQANSCCGNEWITHGRTGLIVPTDDIVALSEAILIAATADSLVDCALEENRATVEARWNAKINGPEILRGYREIIAGSGDSRRKCRESSTLRPNASFGRQFLARMFRLRSKVLPRKLAQRRDRHGR